MINFNKLNLTEGMDPIEQSASDSATQSTEKKRDPSRIQRQKIQMAQSPGNKVKSNTVYASESVNKVKTYNRQKSDWRSEIKEAKDEIEHPYVDVMPMTNGSEKRAKEEMKLAKKVGVSNANQVIGEEMDFEELIGKLYEADRLMTGDEYHAKMKEKNKAPINPYPVVAKPKAKPQSRKPQPKSTKSPEERMADAYASPRKGPGGAVRAD